MSTGDRAVAAAFRNLLPLLVVMHVIAYVDRLNITFAETQIRADLALSAGIFGLAAGIFFLGYIAVEVPSNLILHRVGARLWMARIMILWGIVASATALVWDATSLVAARILLGVMEAGFFPGVVYYLTLWIPAAERGRAMGIFMLGIPIATLIGGPLAGALLSLDGIAGLEGWQWLFLIEGIPAVAVGFWVLARLPDRPQDARWLARDERVWLEATLAREAAAIEHTHASFDLRAALRDPRITRLASIYFCINVAGYGAVFWLADIVERVGDISDLAVGMIAAIPFGFGTLGLLVLGARADRGGDRRRYVVAGALLGVAGLVGTALLPPVPAIAAMCVGTFGLLGCIPAFWGMPAAILTGRAAAGGIALVNCIGVMGGMFGPVIVGALRDASDSLGPGLLALAVVLTFGAWLCGRLELAARSSAGSRSEAAAPAPAPAP